MALSPLSSQPISIPLDLRQELPDPLTPWHISDRIFDEMQQTAAPSQLYRKAQALPTDAEWRFIWRYFHHDKPTKYGLKRVHCVHERHQMTAFEGNLSSMEREAKAFKAAWNLEPRADQRAVAIKRWKQTTDIFSPFQTKEADGRLNTWADTKVMPLWHGSSPDKCDSISTSGFVYFGKTSLGAKQPTDPQNTDEGYFGSGIYFTNSARYASDIYSKGHILLAWVSMREPFPVVGDPQQTDMKTLKGRGAYKSYNAHYVPVVPLQSNAACAVYHPCKIGELPVCDEVVVFHKSQTLPRFWVELEVEAPYLLTLQNAPLFAGQLIPHLLKILQNPDVDQDLKLRNVFNKELARLLRLKADDDLEVHHKMLFQQLPQLIDSTGKIDKTVRDALTSSPPTLRNWKAEPKIQTIQGHTNYVTTLIELKDGTLASGSYDHTIKLWSRDGACLATFKDHTAIFTLTELKDGILACGLWVDIKLWKRDGTCLDTLPRYLGGADALIELKDGILASGSHEIQLWSRDGSYRATLKGHARGVCTLIELKDGTLASGSYDNTIRLWNRDGACLTTFTGHTGWVTTLIELKDSTFASGSQDKTIKLWGRDGSCLTTFTGYTSAVCTLIELKDGTLASGSSDGLIKLWKRDGSCLATVTGHKSHINALVELKDGTLASASNDNTIKLWTFPLMN
jgi:hypothetical protein